MLTLIRDKDGMCRCDAFVAATSVFGFNLLAVALLFLTVAAPAGAFAQREPAEVPGETKEWYRSEAGRRLADNILTWQSPAGSWPKNMDTTRQPFTGSANELHGTLDNGATTREMRSLARAFRATQDPRYRQAFLRGLDHILEAQSAWSRKWIEPEKVPAAAKTSRRSNEPVTPRNDSP